MRREKGPQRAARTISALAPRGAGHGVDDVPTLNAKAAFLRPRQSGATIRSGLSGACTAVVQADRRKAKTSDCPLGEKHDFE
jgi:hypothetical protein